MGVSLPRVCPAPPKQHSVCLSEMEGDERLSVDQNKDRSKAVYDNDDDDNNIDDDISTLCSLKADDVLASAYSLPLKSPTLRTTRRR